MATPVKIPATIIDIKKFGDNVIEYTLKPEKRVPHFKAGQFLHLAIDKYDPSFEWPESRVFSIESGNLDRNLIKIVISVVGSFTRRMQQEVKINNTVWLKLPYGDFTFNNINKDLVLIAGGTGVSPFLSFLNSKEILKNENNVSLYYGVKTESNLLQKDFSFLDKNKNVSVTIFIESNDIKNNTNIVKGILDIEKIYKTHGVDAIYYLSGPWTMIDIFKTKLLNNCVAIENIRIDAWA